MSSSSAAASMVRPRSQSDIAAVPNRGPKSMPAGPSPVDRERSSSRTLPLSTETGSPSRLRTKNQNRATGAMNRTSRTTTTIRQLAGFSISVQPWSSPSRFARTTRCARDGRLSIGVSAGAKAVTMADPITSLSIVKKNSNMRRSSEPQCTGHRSGQGGRHVGLVHASSRSCSPPPCSCSRSPSCEA